MHHQIQPVAHSRWFNDCVDVDECVDENQALREPHTHLSCLIIVFHLAQVPAASLGNPLPRHQVPHHHRGRPDLCGQRDKGETTHIQRDTLIQTCGIYIPGCDLQ